MLEKLKSRKLWISVLNAAITGAVVVICKELNLPLSEVEIAAIVMPGLVYVLGQSKVDAAAETAKPELISKF